MSRKRDEHDNLLYYGAVLAVGIIALILGVQELSWEVSIIGALFAAFGGFEVKLTYGRIQLQERSIKASQTGRDNTQINQTNPQNSPTIGRIEKAYFGTTLRAEEQTSESKSRKLPGAKREPEEDQQSSLRDTGGVTICSGQIHFEDYQDFSAHVNRGDRIIGHVEAEHPISVQIMNGDQFDDFDSRYEDNEVYWRSPKTTNYDFSWDARKREDVFVLLVDETDESEWDEGEATATARIEVRMKR